MYTHSRLIGGVVCCTTLTSMKNGECYDKTMANLAPSLPTLCLPNVWERFVVSAKQVLFGTVLNVLLVAVPMALLSNYLHIGNSWVFILSLIGIVPLAERLGFITEQLAYFTGPTVGGLLNATFGNATEMIICVFALQNNMVRVVQLSLLGSILSNMLLVLGCAFLSGGIANSMKEQKFDKAGAHLNSSLLLMAVMCVLFPAALHATRTEIHLGESELMLSRVISGIMLVAYAGYIYFQLCNPPLREEDIEAVENGESEECQVDAWSAIFWLAVLTVFISILSKYIVDAIEGASEAWQIPVAFISVIILPIVGNAAEHTSAIIFAVKDNLDLSLAVAIGSSTQISMLVIPVGVLLGWPMGVNMDLNFELFETAVLFISTIVVAFMLLEGTANYFKGVMLVLCYFVVGASFFAHVDPPVHHVHTL
ncbi:hypothetical protein KC19_4G142700 [Ceratodon purpureus]|uniref:Vacuolar cation/proton exchanger n=1 Tax=Ceratodon purpureus TaxID=3225 RepID=A0A8T0I8V1_CERPU|nr:hypothetical protein KC19_4G142700 [Ceratodon purpureus]